MMAPPEQVVQMLAEAQAQFGESVALTCSKPYFLEVNPPLATKGHALSVCAEEMGFPLSQCMAFGDSLNDVSMLRAAGHGVCHEQRARGREAHGLCRLRDKSGGRRGAVYPADSF